jgi:hypothetical protein
MVELIINNRSVDISDSKVKYIKQVNDLADVTTVNASYSYSIKAEKTPTNTQIFLGLGLIGNTSNVPYKKNLTRLIDNGVVLIPNGVSYVKETADDYKIVIQDGIVDFFRSIENRTIGLDLDLSELSHTKNDVNIVASFGRTDYKYLISEYNGWTVRDGTLNPDYQVPSINNKYIFDKIMAYAGYTYENMPDISNEWTTFPTPPTIPTDEEILRFKGFLSVTQDITLYEDWRDYFIPTWGSVTTYDTAFLQLINNWKLKIKQTGNYKADFNISGSMLYAVLEGNQLYTQSMPIKMVLYQNGNPISSVISPNATIKNFNGGANNVLEFYPDTLTRQEAEDLGYNDERFLNALEDGTFYIAKIIIGAFNAEISTMGVEVFDFGEAFKDYSMTDFVKEVMFRKSLTPFPDVNAKHISFKTLAQRVSTSNAINWTSKYARRTKEEYQFGIYAKQNSLVMKHDNQEETFGNGYLPVPNDNLKDSTTLLQSKYFAPSGDLKAIRNINGEFFLEIKFWEREVKEDDGAQVIEYKPLSNRFFLLKEQTVNKTIEIGEIEVTSFPKAIMDGTKMSDVVNDYYSSWGVIFNRLTIQDIELALNEYDVATLRLDLPYYFEQEGAFYLLNKLNYESGKLASGEFLKISN